MVQYRVQILETLAPWGFARHMKVQRADGKPGISWDDLQRLKDEYLGTDVLAVELYPPADQVVNEVNMRHLWEVPEHVLPIGLKRFGTQDSPFLPKKGLQHDTTNDG